MIFAGNPLDRASEHRTDPAWLAARKADGRILPLWRLQPLVAENRARFLARGAWEALAAPDAPCVFLGLEPDGRALFALDISAADDPLAGPLAGQGEFLELRPAAFVLPAGETAILGQAKALIDWHQRHRFCPNCGALTNFADGGYRRLCPACGAEHFPRTDPCVIMLPLDGDHCLIGRNTRFPAGLYSAFAGFIEPGESIEEAVARELREEVGLRIGAVRYFAAQPWPFPSSLMIGCFADALSRDFRADGQEIEDARWMHKDEIRARLAGTITDNIRMPATIAIAHALLKEWVA